MLAVKGNHTRLREGMADVFDLARSSGLDDIDHGYHETVDAGHGRVETRRCWTVSHPGNAKYVDEYG